MTINIEGRMRLRKICGDPVGNLRYLQNLSDYNEKGLLRERDRRERSLKKIIAKKINENDKAFTSGFYQDEISRFDENLPKIMRYALFVATMSIAESSIVLLCRASNEILRFHKNFNKNEKVIIEGIEFLQNNAKIDLFKKPYEKFYAKLEVLPASLAFPDDLRDRIHYNESEQHLVFKGIMTEKVKKKLLAPYESYTKAIEELFLKSPVGWIEDLRKVRNYIIHANGILDEKDGAKDIRKFVERNRRIIDIDKSDNSIILHKNCVEDISNEMISLIKFLYNSIEEKIDSL